MPQPTSIETSLRLAEQFLEDRGVSFTQEADNYLQVGDLSLQGMELAKLPDLSRVKVFGGFNCSDNKLTSLKGCPPFVGGAMNCCGNRLTSMEHAPVCGTIFSDFGSFRASNPIPDKLLPETTARRERERLNAILVLQAPTTVARPLRFKNRACPAP